MSYNQGVINLKKIVMITECLTEGVGKHIVELYQNLSKEYFKVYILYGEKRANDNYLKMIDNAIEGKDITELVDEETLKEANETIARHKDE